MIAAIARVDVLPRSDRDRRRFQVTAETPIGSVTVMLTEGQEGWQGRFPDGTPAQQRKAVIRAFTAWRSSHDATDLVSARENA